MQDIAYQRVHTNIAERRRKAKFNFILFGNNIYYLPASSPCKSEKFGQLNPTLIYHMISPYQGGPAARLNI